MLDSKLAASFSISRDIVPKARLDEFMKLASQVSLEERESLYAAARYSYSGEGEIWDLGCAAGGSSYCLAAGLKDKNQKPDNTVKCFDLFEGYSAESFKGMFDRNLDDIDIFKIQTKPVQEQVEAVKMNIVTEINSYNVNLPVELAHIDVAKSLELWKAVFRRISNGILPNKTIWIFQDFERVRLTWQIYSMVELLKFGEIIGGANYGTIYLKFNSVLDSLTRNKIINDDFTMHERTENVSNIFKMIRSNYMDCFPETYLKLDDLQNTALAYCYYWQKEKEMARRILKGTSEGFFAYPGNSIYADEIMSLGPMAA